MNRVADILNFQALRFFWGAAEGESSDFFGLGMAQTLAVLEESRAILQQPVPFLFPDPAFRAKEMFEMLQRQSRLFLPQPELQPTVSVFSTAAGQFLSGSFRGATFLRPKRGGVRNHDILKQMDLAVREKWSLLQFSEWLQRKVGENPQRQFLVATFWGVVDRQILDGEIASPRVRKTLLEIGASLKVPVDHSTIFRWTCKWAQFALAMKEEKALRPFSSQTRSHLSRFQKGELLKSLFEKASIGIPSSMRLFELLNQHGFHNEALMISNLLRGIHDEPRVSVKALCLTGLTPRAFVYMERRMQMLATRYRFPMKESGS